jgi:hypothetical protein
MTQNRKKNPNAVRLGKRLAELRTPQERTEAARHAALARWNKEEQLAEKT